MARPRKVGGETPQLRDRPATTPEEVENRHIALTMDLVERQLRDGSASAQVITHYLKRASSRDRLEMRKLELENELLIARTTALAEAKVSEEMYGKAIAAMRSYQGIEDDVDEPY